MSEKALIIGAGPAGLAAASRLLKNGVKPIVLEKDSQVGGISRTVRYKGFYFDLGGHRFYTRNPEVMEWWKGLLSDDFRLTPRLSRIYYRGQFFRYPLSMADVLSKTGAGGMLSVLSSYLRARCFPCKDESSLESWLRNRFGDTLYRLFFKDYSEKVWGRKCAQLSSDLAMARVKGLSLSEVARNALSRGRGNAVKSLISEFYYPRRGSGMMYEAACRRIGDQGGMVRLGSEVVSIRHDGGRVSSVLARNNGGKSEEYAADHFCSSMPLTSLVALMEPLPAPEVIKACGQLRYRSMLLVFCVVKRAELSRDTWIYVHSNEVKMSRIQVFKNWSPEMVPDPAMSSLGLEYFCDEGDSLWSLPDEQLLHLARTELEYLKLCRSEEIVDGCVVRVAKAYPLYEKGYRQALETVSGFLRRFPNLHCMGRYGSFHYNSMDHSVLSGFLAAGNCAGQKNDLWHIPMGSGE